MSKEMTIDSNVNMRKKVTSVVCETLTMEEVDPEQDLIESGYLDSLALIQVMVALEEAFDITIEPEEMDMEDYRSIASISRLITRLTSESEEFHNHG